MQVSMDISNICQTLRFTNGEKSMLDRNSESNCVYDNKSVIYTVNGRVNDHEGKKVVIILLNTHLKKINLKSSRNQMMTVSFCSTLFASRMTNIQLPKTFAALMELKSPQMKL